jgi:hypothetical protein
MNAMRVFIFTPLIILLLASSCERSHHYDHPLSLQLKDHVYFQMNSKWIYQDDSTMTKDTVVVIKAESTQSCSQIDTEVDCAENIKITYSSSNRGLSFTDRTNNYGMSARNEITRSPGEIQIPSVDMYVYKDETQFFSSAIVNGITYMNVVKTHTSNNLQGTPDYRAADYYWARNAGNIKKVFFNGSAITSWSLIDKEVYQ